MEVHLDICTPAVEEPDEEEAAFGVGRSGGDSVEMHAALHQPVKAAPRSQRVLWMSERPAWMDAVKQVSAVASHARTPVASWKGTRAVM